MRAPMHPNYRNSFARTALTALPQWPILSNRRERTRVRVPRYRRIGRSDALALQSNGERHSGSSPQGLTRGPGQLPLIGASSFSAAGNRPESCSRIRGVAKATPRQEVFVSIFRSGPVSDHRLARFHLAAVVIACTAKARGDNRHKLAQMGRAAA